MKYNNLSSILFCAVFIFLVSECSATFNSESFKAVERRQLYEINYDTLIWKILHSSKPFTLEE